MPDRIIRDELLHSERWLELPTDVARLAFVGFLLIADDFGNFEGGPRRLFRFLHGITQIKTEAAASEAIDSLMACDLIRRYEVDERELFHIPRFRPHRQYLSRKYPQSPWDDAKQLGKAKRVSDTGLAKHQRLTENLAATSQRRGSDVAEGVGVGVGVGVIQTTTTAVMGSQSPRARTLDDPKPAAAAILIPLNDKTEFAVTPQMVAEWESLYPNVDVPQTLREIRGWNLANTTRRKPRSEILDHINTWLRKEQAS